MFLSVLGACESAPDPRTPDGFMGYVATALEEDDAARLYRVIDARSRHAMISIVNDRRAAAALIEADYPEEERAEAMRGLGDAATVPDAEALFALRCGSECRSDFSARVGAVVEQTDVGEVTRFTTTRGDVLGYREAEGHWWGLVWSVEALDDERSRANQDLAAVERNAATYRRRRELESP